MRHIPIFTFINKMDRDANDTFDLLDEIEKELGIATCPINWPIGSGKKFRGVYDRDTEKILTFSDTQKGTKEGVIEEIPLSDSRADEIMDPEQKAQLLDEIELLDGDVRQPVEHFEPYGFTSEPLQDAEALAVSLGGDRDHTIALVATDRRYRPVNLKDGEVVVFDDLGRKVFLSRDGIKVEGVASPVTVKTTASVLVDAPLTKCTGNLEVGGNIVAGGEVKDKGGSFSMSGMRATYNSHTHNGGSSPDQKM